jgi:putative SOS response-associated peptidase YedK
MCGRFSHRLSWAEIHALYNLTLGRPSNLEPRFNVCPTDTIHTVVERDGGRELLPMRWGLVPRWWKKSLKELPATFNARAETVAEKPMFRSAFKRTRCVIPLSGYFEWKAAPDGKQPFYFSRADGAPITIAGLWDEWRDPESGDALKSLHHDYHRGGRVHSRHARPHAGGSWMRRASRHGYPGRPARSF